MQLDAPWIRERIVASLHLRDSIIPEDTDAFRWIHGEGDGLPGIVCDRYGEVAVVKFDGEAIRQNPWRKQILDVLREELPKKGIKALLHRVGRGHDKEVTQLWGEKVLPELTVHEYGMKLSVNLYEGQKTGLFLDHRESRRDIYTLCKRFATAEGRAPRVLNLYSYTGGFSIAAGLGGAEKVVSVDVSGSCHGDGSSKLGTE